MKSEKPKLDNAHFINPYFACTNNDVDILTDKIAELLKAQKNICTSKSLFSNLSAFLTNIICRWQDDPSSWLIVPQSASSYSNNRFLKNTAGYTCRTIKLTQELECLGLIHKITGYQGNSDCPGKYSRFQMTDKLLWIVKEQADYYHICPLLEQPTIVLRDEDKNAIEYEESTYIAEISSELKACNYLINNTKIEIPQKIKDKISETNPIDCRRTFTRRIFNNSSFKQGGRFYGGWWQNVEKKYRKSILINGQPCVEIDYSGLHVRMLYSLQGVANHEALPSDLYNIPISIEEDPQQARAIVKMSVMILLNASSRKKAIGAIRKELAATKRYKDLSDPRISEIISNIENTHSSLKEHFSSGIGVKLQNDDSEMAGNIINRFTARNVPILCIHDSFIVQESYAYDLRYAMRHAYSNFYQGHTIGLK